MGVAIYLLCAIAQAGGVKKKGFSWTPGDAGNPILWTDAHGAHAGTQTVFNSPVALGGADIPTVTSVTFGPDTTSFKNLSSLPALVTLNCGSCSFSGSMDLSNCYNLQTVNCDFNAITYLNLTGDTFLVTLNCNGNQISSLNLSGFTHLTTVTCGFNQLGTVNITGDFSIVTFWAGGNPSLNVVGP